VDRARFVNHRRKSCKDRSPDELKQGLALVGRRLVRATELSWLLTESQEGPTRGTRASETVVAAMLTWERSLVEFVLGPVLKWKPDGTATFIMAPSFLRQNLCPWCFGVSWRLEDNDPELHKLINARWDSISRHLAHLSFKEAKNPRQFNLDKIVNVADALDRFATALRLESADSQLGERLTRQVHLTKTIAAQGVRERTPVKI
jgi:hypothetical protein